MNEKEHLSTAERTFKIQIPARVPLLRRMFFPANFIVLNPVSTLPEQPSILLCLLSSVDWISDPDVVVGSPEGGNWSTLVQCHQQPGICSSGQADIPGSLDGENPHPFFLRANISMLQIKPTYRQSR